MVDKRIFIAVIALSLVYSLSYASQYENATLGNITSDSNLYNCWTDECTALINLTVNPLSPYANELWNLSLYNSDDNSANITYKIFWHNGSNWINQSENNSLVNATNYNLTSTTHQFLINITFPYALSAKWNLTFSINETNFTLSTFLDSINLTSPADYNLTASLRPSFNFTLFSNNWTTQSCTILMRVNNTGNWISYGTNSSTINNTPAVITANSPLSEGNYTWKVSCNVSGNSSIRWIYIDAPPVLGNITSDSSVYSCWKNSTSYDACTAYVNLTVDSNSPYANELWNLSLYNSADVSGIRYKIFWHNGSNWINQTENNTLVNNTNYNLTSTTHQFLINITLPYALSAEWNVTFNLNSTNYTFSTFLDSINLTSPANYNLTNATQAPSFNFTLFSKNWTIQSCKLYLNINNTGSWVPYGINSSTLNNTPTVITANASLSEGNYTWKITCNVSGNSTYRWIFVKDITGPDISGRAVDASTDSAIITWTTDELSNSSITYGENSTVLDDGEEYDSGLVTNHSITLIELYDDTKYYYNITSCDVHGNCNTEGPYYFTTDEVTSSSVAAAGGGAAAATATVSSNKSNTWSSISPGIMAVWNVNDKILAIKQINLSVSNTLYNVRLIAQRYTANPVSTSKSGKIYRYLKIESTNLANLSKADILLQVEKIWVTNNSLSKEDVFLYRFNSTHSEWKALPTTYVSEDATYYYYNAQLPAFSYFSIAAESSSSPSSSSSSAASTDSNSSVSLTESPQDILEGEKQYLRIGTISVIVLIGILSLLSIGFIVYTQLIRKREIDDAASPIKKSDTPKK